MIKKATLLALTALAAATSAHANSVVLEVKGSVVPSPCSLLLSNDGTVNLGNIDAETLNPTAPTKLTSGSILASVRCDAATQFALAVTDDRSASADATAAAVAKTGATASQAFGLGTSGEANIGAYVLTLSEGTADGTATTFISSIDKATWSAATMLQPGDNVTAWKGATMAPISAKVASASLKVDAAIAATDTLDLSSAVALDGHATLELIYL